MSLSCNECVSTKLKQKQDLPHKTKKTVFVEKNDFKKFSQVYNDMKVGFKILRKKKIKIGFEISEIYL